MTETASTWDHMKNIALLIALVLSVMVLSSCGDSGESAGGGTSSTSNGTTATSNGTTATSNGTTATSNGTTNTSNGTTATSNGTTNTSNGTTNTSNATTATSNGTMPGCMSDAQCDQGEICEGETCIDGCRDDAGCDNGELCLAMLCEPGCRDDGACDQGQICEELTCVVGCRENIDCGSGRYCDDGSMCVVGCDNDTMCGADRVCLANICTEGCRVDSECPNNRICEANACRNGCRDNDQCSAGQICVATACRAGCRDNDGCPAEQICQNGACQEPVINCEDDNLEPDNLTTNATVVAGGNTTYLDRALCPGDLDLYRLNLSTGMALTAGLAFTRADGNLSLNLLDAGGEFIRSSRVWPDSEILRFTADTAGIYYLAVSGSDEHQSNTYRLNIITDGGILPCQDDGLEPNDRFEQGTAIMGNTTLTSVSCPGDEDWFRIPAMANTRVTASITFDNDASNLELFLLEGNGSTLITSSETNGDVEQVTYTANATGNLYLRLLTNDPDFGAPYQLRVTFSSLCDDFYDPNDTFNAPALLVAGDYNDLVLCDGGNDFFSIALEQGETLEASVLSDSAANLDLFILSPGGQMVLDSSTSPGSVEDASVVAETRGLYIVRVQFITGPTAPAFYDLNLNIIPASVVLNCNDAFEPNNSVALANPAITAVGATVCANDIDYYSFAVNRPGTEIRLFVQVTDPSIAISYAILAHDGVTVLAEYMGNNNPVVISTTAPVAGTYYARLIHESGFSTTYTLSRILLAPPDCDDDAYEPNNTFIQAAELTGEIPNGILCSDDTDIFKINVAEPFTRLRILTQLTRETPNATVELLNPMFELLNTADLSDTGVANFRYLTPEPGLFYVRLRQTNGADQLFNISETQTVLPYCIDQFETNDLFSEAPIIGEGQWSDLSLCWEFDEADYYAVDLINGARLTVTISFDNAAGNIDLLLLGSDGMSVRGMSFTDNDVEQIVFTAPALGRYYIRAQSLNMDSNYYSMEVNIE